MTKFMLAAFVVLILAVSVAPARAESFLAPAQVGIQNKTGASVRIIFTGAGYYAFSLSNGKTKVEMEPGAYSFSYEACGSTQTGKLKVKATGTNLVLPKCPKEKAGCDKSYPTVCIPPRPPDLDCPDVPFSSFKVIGKDPHNFDGDHDGIGCEPYR